MTHDPARFSVSTHEQNLGFREAGSTNAAAVGKDFPNDGLCSTTPQSRFMKVSLHSGEGGPRMVPRRSQSRALAASVDVFT